MERDCISVVLNLQGKRVPLKDLTMEFGLSFFVKQPIKGGQVHGHNMEVWE